MDNPSITVTEKRKIIKYDVGVDPATGQPYQVVQATIIYTGQDAINFLKALKQI